jgi:hypothetical protein
VCVTQANKHGRSSCKTATFIRLRERHDGRVMRLVRSPGVQVQMPQEPNGAVVVVGRFTSEVTPTIKQCVCSDANARRWLALAPVSAQQQRRRWRRAGTCAKQTTPVSELLGQLLCKCRPLLGAGQARREWCRWPTGSNRDETQATGWRRRAALLRN